MKKTLSVAKWEYKSRIFKRSFLVLTIAVPLLLSFLYLYVLDKDNTGKISPKLSVEIISNNNLLKKSYANFINNNQNYNNCFIVLDFKDNNFYQNNFASAIARLDNRDTDLVINVTSDTTFTVHTIRSLNKYEQNLLSASINNFLYNSISQKYPEFKNNYNGYNLTNIEYDVIKTQKPQTGNRMLAGFALSLLFIFTTLSTGNLYINALSEEKNSGILEIVLSSINKVQLFTGKLIGLFFTGITQAFLWYIIFSVLTSHRSFSAMEYIPSEAVFVIIPGFLVYAVLFLLAGAFLKDDFSSQQVSSLLAFVMLLPLILAGLLLYPENHIIKYVLLYFPLTSTQTALIFMGINDLSNLELIFVAFMNLNMLVALLYFGASLFKKGDIFRKKPSKTKKSLK